MIETLPAELGSVVTASGLLTEKVIDVEAETTAAEKVAAVDLP